MRKNLSILLKVLSAWKWRFFSAAILLIAGIFVRSLEPKILQLAVDAVLVPALGGTEFSTSDFFAHQLNLLLPQDRSADNLKRVLMLLGIIYIGIAFFRGVLVLSASALNAASTESAIKYLRDRVFRHIQALPIGYHHKMSTGELVQRSTGDIDTVRKFILDQLVDVIRLTTIFLFSFIMMATVNVPFALISICVVPLITGSAYIFFRKEAKIWQEHEDEADRLNSIAQDNINGIRVVQANANEAFEMRRFDDQNLRKRSIGIRHVNLHTLFWPFSDFLVLLQIGISLVAGAWFVMSAQITLGEMLSFYTYVIMVAWPLRHAGRVISRMGMAGVAIGRIMEILEAPEEEYQGECIPKDEIDTIEIKNLSFAFPNSEEQVLSNINLSLKRGETIGITGSTGSGKSTLALLLLGYYPVDKGEILINGEPIDRIEKAELRKKIGLVHQKAFLFSTSIAGNIAYTDQKAAAPQIDKAAQIAQIAHFHDSMPEGFETVVGEKGVTLSGGQKQRVALSRTLLAEPQMLILDDVTSALDTETESLIMQKLDEENSARIRMLISHRVTSLKKTDRIVVLDKGRIEAIGSHDELIEQSPYYRSICKLQQIIEKEIVKEISSSKIDESK